MLWIEHYKIYSVKLNMIVKIYHANSFKNCQSSSNNFSSIDIRASGFQLFCYSVICIIAMN